MSVLRRTSLGELSPGDSIRRETRFANSVGRISIGENADETMAMDRLAESGADLGEVSLPFAKSVFSKSESGRKLRKIISKPIHDTSYNISRQKTSELLSLVATLAALLTGFTVSAMSTIGNADIAQYVAWELDTFVGVNSTFCRVMQPDGHHGGQRCDENGCAVWRGGGGGVHDCSATADREWDRSAELVREIVAHERGLGVRLMLSTLIGVVVTVAAVWMWYSSLLFSAASAPQHEGPTDRPSRGTAPSAA